VKGKHISKAMKEKENFKYKSILHVKFVMPVAEGPNLEKEWQS